MAAGALTAGRGGGMTGGRSTGLRVYMIRYANPAAVIATEMKTMAVAFIDLSSPPGMCALSIMPAPFNLPRL
jgi:hypothetical protein